MNFFVASTPPGRVTAQPASHMDGPRAGSVHRDNDRRDGRPRFTRSPLHRSMVESPNNTTDAEGARRVLTLVVAFLAFQHLRPTSTSTEIVSGLNSAVGRALDIDAFKARLVEQSFEPKRCTPADFAQLIRSDLEQWAATVKAFGFKPMD